MEARIEGSNALAWVGACTVVLSLGALFYFVLWHLEKEFSSKDEASSQSIHAHANCGHDIENDGSQGRQKTLVRK